MGFPRIISKNNKIYTKLGEFCLSGDGNSFWILCHTCQEELQTQDQFWKHIQDEHNFMHGLNKHEADPNASMLPLPLYRKLNEDEQRAEAEDDSHDPQERKNYADMRTIEMDIKTEPQVTAQQAVAAAVAAGHAASHVELGGGGGGGGGATVYAQLPQVPPGSAYAALVQQHTGVTAMPTTTLGHMSAAAAVAAAAAGGGGGGGGGNILPPQLMPQELPKDSNSTTASAGSAAVSSDDGERWYICDYESCGLKFKYQSRLELHRSVHSKERRFACEVCGASFKQSCNLSTHRKKKHSLKGAKSNNNSGVGIGGGGNALLQQRF